MHSADDFHYALENTRVLHEPEQRIETFGSTIFHFHLISEVMDRVNEIKIRDGEIHAQQPEIVAPANMRKLLLDGFGEQAEEFAEILQQQMGNFALLKYGFVVRKFDVQESSVSDPLDDVIARVKDKVKSMSNPMNAIIHGVDDAWEVCLLKFTMDMMQRSARGNVDDFRERGII